MKKFLCLALLVAVLMMSASSAFALTGTATVDKDGVLTYSVSDIDTYLEVYLNEVNAQPIGTFFEDTEGVVYDGDEVKVGDKLILGDVSSTVEIEITAAVEPEPSQEPETPAYEVTFDVDTLTGTITPTTKATLNPPVIRYALSYYDTRVGDKEGVGDIATINPVLNEDGSGTFKISKTLNAAQIVNLVYVQVVEDSTAGDKETNKDYTAYGENLWTLAAAE